MITHIKDPDSDRCIVFIHGLGGGKSTWLKFSNYLNKKWDYEFGFLLKYFLYYKNILDKEAILNDVKSKFIRFVVHICLFFPGLFYFLIKIIWSKRNSHNVKLLESYIDENCQNSKNIILVAHSMGGLIARQFLINCRKNNSDIKRYRMLITYATPHKGSHKAKLISIKKLKTINAIYSRISNLLNYRISPQIGDLVDLNDFIKNIDNDWRDYDLERKIVFLRVVAKKDKLVKRESAKLHENDVLNIFECDYGHSDIIRPHKKVSKFEPIDVFINALNRIDYIEDYYDELESEIDYDDDSEDLDTY